MHPEARRVRETEPLSFCAGERTESLPSMSRPLPRQKASVSTFTVLPQCLRSIGQILHCSQTRHDLPFSGDRKRIGGRFVQGRHLYRRRGNWRNFVGLPDTVVAPRSLRMREPDPFTKQKLGGSAKHAGWHTCSSPMTRRRDSANR
jgi:hypothetical protein